MNNKAQRLIQYLKTIDSTEGICHAVSCGADSCIGCPLEDAGAFQATLASVAVKEDIANEQP